MPLTRPERRYLEDLFGMGSGYVLSFSNRTFSDFFAHYCGEVDIDDTKYQTYGTSKANRLRSFWDQEPDYMVARFLEGVIDDEQVEPDERLREIIIRLKSAPGHVVSIQHAKRIGDELNAAFISRQCHRMQEALEKDDPELAIGSAKEFLESLAKAIIHARSIPMETSKPDLRVMVKACLKDMELVPDAISDKTKAKDTIKRVLSNLSTIVDGIDELRNHYGTGHGPGHAYQGLQIRHARLVVNAATALGVFLYDTHQYKSAARKEEVVV